MSGDETTFTQYDGARSALAAPEGVVSPQE